MGATAQPRGLLAWEAALAAIDRRDLPDLATCLTGLRRGGWIDAVVQGASDDASLLHHAAVAGWLPGIRLLLEAGADAAITDGEGRTPAVLARMRGQSDAAAMLTPPAVASVRANARRAGRAALMRALTGGRDLSGSLSA